MPTHPAHGGPRWAGQRASPDPLSPQQAALHPKLHPHEPVCVLRAQGQLCAGHRHAARDTLQPEDRSINGNFSLLLVLVTLYLHKEKMPSIFKSLVYSINI